MPMTDTDHLSTPTDMVEILKRLTKLMRDVEALPDNAQQRFWDDTEHSLEAISSEDLRLDGAASARSVSVLYNILVAVCGQQLAEMVNGATKEYYESIISQMKEVTHRSWDTFLDQKFDETKGTDHEGSVGASVALHTLNNIGIGILKRVEGTSKLLSLTDVTPDSNKTRYFSSKDIIMMEFTRRTPPSAPGAPADRK
jgi:hypothetical protein